VEADDLSVGTRNRSARRNWNALSDRAAGESEMVVRLHVSCKSMNTATCRCAFVRNDCAAWIERAVRNVGSFGYADTQRLFGAFTASARASKATNFPKMTARILEIAGAATGLAS
jgi:hypothetical protein